MFGIVVDKNNFKVAFSPLNEDKTPQGHDLQVGEMVIETDWDIANSMNKPKWDRVNKKWIDTEPLPPIESPIKEVDKIDILEQQLVNTQKLLVDLQMEVLMNSF